MSWVGSLKFTENVLIQFKKFLKINIKIIKIVFTIIIIYVIIIIGQELINDE